MVGKMEVWIIQLVDGLQYPSDRWHPFRTDVYNLGINTRMPSYLMA